MKTYDCIIVGAGPAGLAAALYMARFGRKIILLDKLAPGGLLLQTFEIENYPGVKKIRGYELADAMDAQLAEYPADRLQSDVLGIEAVSGGYLARLPEETILGRTVIVCSGLKYRKLGVPREDELIGQGISYCALCDGNFFRNQKVGVVGGGNSALEEAIYLAGLASEVHIIHRRDAFRADKIYQDKIQAVPNITVHYSSKVTELHGEKELTGVTLASAVSSETRLLPLNGLFIFAGYEPSAGFLPEGLERDKSGFVITDAEMRTNLPGFFAAGDIRSKHCRQVVTAVGDGATAAHSAFTYLEK